MIAGTFLTTTIVFMLKLQIFERVEMASDKRVLKSISLLEVESIVHSVIRLNFWQRRISLRGNFPLRVRRLHNSYLSRLHHSLSPCCVVYYVSIFALNQASSLASQRHQTHCMKSPAVISLSERIRDLPYLSCFIARSR